jgi:soluble lytic murein transglycosylase-like protein
VGRGGSRNGIGGLLDSAASRHGIPPDILKAVAWQESGWNPSARSFDGGHGKGVMQIDDRYHGFAKTGAVFDPARNIEYGANYLSDLYRQTGSWDRALQRYNGGSTYPGKVMALARKRPWGG